MNDTLKTMSNGMRMKSEDCRYKVWFKRGNVFDTLEMATEYANLVYFRKGLIVAITKVK